MPRLPRLGRLAAALFLSLALVPAAAASERLRQLLETVTAGPLQAPGFIVSYVDFASLYAAAGLDRAGWRAQDGSPDELQVKRLRNAYQRISTDVRHLAYMHLAGDNWIYWFGFDYIDMDWTLTLGEPPGQVIYLGFDQAPAAAIETALTARGLERRVADDAIYFALGEEGQIDPKNRRNSFPFWGSLGASERLALLPHALLGSRSTPVTAAAVGDPRLATYPGLATLLAVAAEGGELLQFTLVADDFSPDYVKALLPPGASREELEAQAPGPLPPFRLLLLADRQGEAGEDALVALLYDSPADAAVAAATLLERVAVYRAARQSKPLLQAMRLVAETRVVEAGDGAVTLLRLSQDPEYRGLRDPGLAYRGLMRGLQQRDLGWLTWR